MPVQTLHEHELHGTLFDEDGLFDDSELSDVYGKLLDGKGWPAMERLFECLNVRQRESSDQEWKEFIKICFRHPLRELVHQDPFTYRGFSKPRGYAGDAILMDYIYDAPVLKNGPEGCSEVGRQVFQFITNLRCAKAVRNRRDIVAKRIDAKALQVNQPSVLAIAAGHMREAEHCQALQQGRIGKWMAFDSDTLSLNEVARCYSRYGVTTIAGSVRQLLTRKVHLGKADFVYSTGMFDYLHEALAKRLVQHFFDVLTPGGQLLIANFLPGHIEQGYMESYMDWCLVYRTPQDMLDLAMAVDQALIQDINLFYEDERSIIFLQLTRK
jgi:SAM-dependent methyltransferase